MSADRECHRDPVRTGSPACRSDSGHRVHVGGDGAIFCAFTFCAITLRSWLRRFHLAENEAHGTDWVFGKALGGMALLLVQVNFKARGESALGRNVFCVLEPRPIYRDTGRIAAVVVNYVDLRAMATIGPCTR